MLRSLFWIFVVVADIWAIMRTFQSNASNVEKLLWTLLILIFPIIGLIIWYFAGPGKKTI